MQRTWKTLLPLAVLIVVIGYLYVQRRAPLMPPVAAPPPIVTPAQAPASANANPSASPPSGEAARQLPAFLPPEARTTLALIESGGPFPHPQDGEVFGNYEHRLPEEPRGYYHEYTVETAGLGYRGARRIITGGNPPVVYYYTGDHYRTFRRFTVPR